MNNSKGSQENENVSVKKNSLQEEIKIAETEDAASVTAASSEVNLYSSPGIFNLETLLDPISPSSLGIPESDNSAERALPDRIDQYYDDRHTVPFLIEKETFPVPVNISSDIWFPGKPLRISYISWNMAHKEPNFNEVSLHCIHPNAHIIVVCTQENGSHLGLKREQHKWENYIEETCLQGQYNLVGHKTLWYIQLLVFARSKDVAQYVRQIDSSSVKTGIANGLCGNKGGVAVAMAISMTISPLHVRSEVKKNDNVEATSMELATSLFSPSKRKQKILESSDYNNSNTNNNDYEYYHSSDMDTPFITILFIGAHLAAHQKGVSLRNKDYHAIVRGLQVGFKGKHREFFKKNLFKKSDKSHSSNNGANQSCTSEKNYNNINSNVDNESTMQYLNYDNNSNENLDNDNNISLMQLPVTDTDNELKVHRDVTEEFDLVFFGGDLNYRINGTRKAIEYIIKYHKDIRSILVHNDQLNLERAKGVVFQRFCEGNLLFRPTYKYELQHESYSFTKKKDRMPAYCDRVLYKKGKGSKAGKVKIRLYTDVPQVKSSDHRPIVAIFDLFTRAYKSPVST